VIAEVGTWSNPISPNEKQRNAAIKKCRDQLALAERIGASCCVNIAGSCNPILKELNKLPHVPLMMEHLKSQEEYRLAADHIRSVARKNGFFSIKNGKMSDPRKDSSVYVRMCSQSARLSLPFVIWKTR
jgi:hypothetical protein